MLTFVILVVVLALVFDYINGMHDTANAIATVVSTRVLSPRNAVLMAAGLNFIGALVSESVAKTMGKGIIDPKLITLTTVTAILIAAIIWNLITWYYGIPSSSSHALVGGIVGGGIAAAGPGVLQLKGIMKVVKGLFISPVVGIILGFGIMILLLWVFQKAKPGRLNKGFRGAQLVSASVMAFSHGMGDAQKSMGIIAMALVAGGFMVGGDKMYVPMWVKLACAGAMALGTAAGGWRIIKTLGHKMIKLEPIHGFAAETAASVVILSASSLGIPVSTTHCISGSIMGVGATRRLNAVRWSVAGRMMSAWVLTIPATALIAFVLEWTFKNVFHI